MKNNKINFSYLENINSKMIVDFIEEEHPQTIALILYHMSPEKASDIIKYLSDDLKPEIIIRIARMGYCSVSVITRISAILEEKIKYISNDNPELNGIGVASDILDSIADREYKNILKSISIIDENLSNNIKQRVTILKSDN